MCGMQKCLNFFGELTEAQQVAAARIFGKRLNSTTRNPSAILTSIAADVQSHHMKQVRLCGCITAVPSGSKSALWQQDGSVNIALFLQLHC